MCDNATTVLRLGTRGSLLARMQSQMVADALKKRHPGLKVELVICKTSGDRMQGRPLGEAGGKGLFTRELEEALQAGEIDLAVHSFKDLPVTVPPTDRSPLVIAAVPVRQDVRDVLVCAHARSLSELPPGAKVGTASLRRRCQILALRPDLRVAPIRGNVDTRIRKLRQGEYDAVVLAMAGLKRSGLFDRTDMNEIPLEQMLPAAAQGALAIQCRQKDERTRKLLAPLDDEPTRQCVELERSLVRELKGDCHSPIAVLAMAEDQRFRLRAAVGARGGQPPVIRAQAEGVWPHCQEALLAVLESLENQGVRKLLMG